MRTLSRAFIGLLALTMLGACAPGTATQTKVVTTDSAASPSSAPTTGPQGTLRIAWSGEPATLSPKMGVLSGSAFSELAITFNSALTYTDASGNILPQIAKEVPSQDNGEWVVNPDGTMVTTYHLRENAKWHDGEPLTAHDFAFAFRVYTDPAVPIYQHTPENYMASVDAPDDHTVVVNWKRPYYRANGLRYTQLDPLPAHLLEDVYDQDVNAFVNGPYWTTNYIGSGPFKVQKWDPGLQITAQAFDDWVLGPPKAQTLEIRFIADPNAILANLLSGDIDISAHPFFPPQLAATLRDRWATDDAGQVTVSQSRLEDMEIQQREVPNWQPALTDLRIRQAILTAIDRDALADQINFGLGGGAADGFVLPSDPLFPEEEAALVKYPYDPARAQALFQDAGWTRGADGLLRDSSGQTFKLEIRATEGPAGENETALIANNWKAIGIDASNYIVPRALAGDGENKATFPGGSTSNRPITPDQFNWASANIPTAQNHWFGANLGGFSDPDVDRLYDAVMTATTPAAWEQNNVALAQRMTATVGSGPLFYPADEIAARRPITGPMGHFTYSAYSWNIFQWGFAS